MRKSETSFLNTNEVIDLYGTPSLSETELRELCTFNSAETKILYGFRELNSAIYFAICLVFFKIKNTLVDFGYRETTPERQHIMMRYFHQKTSPKSLPYDSQTITRIQNKVLRLCNQQRFAGEIISTIKIALLQLAANHPRQRQLCKELLNLFIKHNIAIPAHSTIQNIITEIWNKENTRLRQFYLRNTDKTQRNTVLSLLQKEDYFHSIISIKKDLQGFNTTELNNAIKKHLQLKPIFEIAKIIIPKLKLPAVTINYYASLIHYYNGPRLKQLHALSVQLYLLCYSFNKFKMLNDNMLEALRKRTLGYKDKATEYAKEQALKQLDFIKDTRKKVSNLLIAIKEHLNPTAIPRKMIYQYIPEDELESTAKLLVGEHFDKGLLFWKFIDLNKGSIALNLRELFLNIDFVVTNDLLLHKVATYIKTTLHNKTFNKSPLPSDIAEWISNNDREYVMQDDKIIYNRFEFLFYKKIVHHITTNKLTLKHSIKYKTIDEDLISAKQWKKNKSRVLKDLDFDKLKSPAQRNLKTKKRELTKLYKDVNKNIADGHNEQVKLSFNREGKQIWRLRPLTADSDPNDSLFADFKKRNIVEVIQLVANKTSFFKAFEPILPRATKSRQDNTRIMAVVLANAIRTGARKMASISDFDESELITAEASYVRHETLTNTVNIINNAAAKFPIYKQWYINSIMHASLDGLKLATSVRNIKARYSSKFFGRGMGVSSYNEIFNYFSLASYLIGANEYEGNFTFEMVHHQNTSDIKPDHIATDMHGKNSFNDGLFELTDLMFTPRIPKPHREILWGFGCARDYNGLLIKPTKFIKEELFFAEWDNIQKFVASMLIGETTPSVVISKLSSKNYNSNTKKAFVQYNNIVRSQFLLKYLHDVKFRRAILIALNRGEAYNNLYRAITLLNNGELRGQSEIEMEIWNQCTRLIASIILYYNTYILNSLYHRAKDPAEKQFIIDLSPGAWVHINFLGHYKFCEKFDEKSFDQWLREWNWSKNN